MNGTKRLLVYTLAGQAVLLAVMLALAHFDAKGSCERQSDLRHDRNGHVFATRDFMSAAIELRSRERARLTGQAKVDNDAAVVRFRRDLTLTRYSRGLDCSKLFPDTHPSLPPPSPTAQASLSR